MSPHRYINALEKLDEVCATNSMNGMGAPEWVEPFLVSHTDEFTHVFTNAPFSTSDEMPHGHVAIATGVPEYSEFIRGGNDCATTNPPP